MSVVHHSADAGAADELTALLTGAEVGVTRAAWHPGVDVQVVLLSGAALADPDWLRSVRRGGRVVVVRIEEVARSQVSRALDEEDRQTLDWLFRVNHVWWCPGGSGETFGAILTGIAFDLSEYTRERQLADAVLAWRDSSGDEERLVDDYRLARSMRDLLLALTADQWERRGLQPWVAGQFVEASLRKARRRARRRLLWTAASALAAVLLVATAATLVPLLAQRRLDNRAAVAAAGDPAILAEVPEWSAAQAASLLLHGTAAQKDLARHTLREALDLPWSVSRITTYPDVSSFVLIGDGARAAVVYRDGSTSSFALLDMPTGGLLWARPLPAIYFDVSISPNGETALVVGAKGAASINIGSREVRKLSEIGLRLARLVTADTAVAVGLDATLFRLNVSDGAATTLATFAGVADLRIVDTGRAVALAETPDRQVALVDAETGTLTIAGPVGQLRARGGGVSPDGRRAILPGADGQYWVIDAGGPPRPTGISVPYAPRGVLWTSGDRMVVLSGDRRGEVIHLPGARRLGTVCRDIIRPVDVRGYRGSDLISCGSDGWHSVWRLPDAPLSAPPAGASSRPSAAGVSVTTDGRKVTLSAPAIMADTIFGGFKGRVTGAAVDTDGSRVVVGDSWGDVVVIQRGPDSWTLVSSWRVPDAAAVTAVGWGDGPFATTATGQTWRVPYCGRCGSDEGLIEAFRARFSGCLSERQLSYIDAATRELLGIHVCGAALGVG